MTGENLERLNELLDQLAPVHTTAAIWTAEIRSLLSSTLARADAVRPHVDMETLCVRWRDKACHLGQTHPLHLLERLCRRPNHYLAYEQLLQDAWDGNVRSPETVRSVVRHLRQRLRQAEMGDLAAAVR